jgi:hypothetical protein
MVTMNALVRGPRDRRMGALVLVLATVIAGLGAWLAPPPHSEAVVWAEAAPPTAPRPVGPFERGLAPLSGDREVPLEWMPPGTRQSPVPSDEIFPPQTLTIRFDHRMHVEDLGQRCVDCHTTVPSSDRSSDRLLPDPTATCDRCHDVDHRDLNAVVAGEADQGQCGYCHLGSGASEGRVARMVVPPPNLHFSHRKHLSRNIGCAHCHGRVDKLELATREQLPRMAGCLGCHGMPTPARGEAHAECTTCHLAEPSGAMRTSFSTGPLLPPEWLRQSGHGADWVERHGTIAAMDSAYCASCHEERECVDCHDGRVRPRRVHPNDWLSMHATSAKLDQPRCSSCHQQQSFCADCHRRVGVARDGPVGARPVGARFHPPPAEWTTAPRSANHHAWEAQRNLSACVSCHAERDCATCHAARGVSGGQGVNPHPLGFVDRCARAWSQNPRPCLVCHHPSDQVLSRCR